MGTTSVLLQTREFRRKQGSAGKRREGIWLVGCCARGRGRTAPHCGSWGGGPTGLRVGIADDNGQGARANAKGALGWQPPKRFISHSLSAPQRVSAHAAGALLYAGGAVARRRAGGRRSVARGHGAPPQRRR